MCSAATRIAAAPSVEHKPRDVVGSPDAQRVELTPSRAPDEWLLERRSLSPVPREPDEGMIDAAVHVAFISKKRSGVAQLLQQAGVSVTLLLHAGNRAAERARGLVAELHTRQQAEAVRLGWDCKRLRAQRNVAPAPTRHWWAAHWRVEIRERGPLVIAADASRDSFYGAAIAAVSHLGDFALRAFATHLQVGELELDAVTLESARPSRPPASRCR